MVHAALALSIVFFALLLLAGAAAAHQHVHSGDLEFVIGWGSEPPVEGTQNSIDIGVTHHPDANTTVPVEGVQENLTVTISTGPASAVKAAEPAFGRPGWYTFAILPTREGVYSVRIVGTINGTAFNVTANPEEVLPASDVSFPVADPSPKDLEENATAQQQQIDALKAQLASLNDSSGSAAQVDQLKKDNAALRLDLSTAMTVGALGVVLGLVGTAVGVLGTRKGRGNS